MFGESSVAKNRLLQRIVCCKKPCTVPLLFARIHHPPTSTTPPPPPFLTEHPLIPSPSIRVCATKRVKRVDKRQPPTSCRRPRAPSSEHGTPYPPESLPISLLRQNAVALSRVFRRAATVFSKSPQTECAPRQNDTPVLKDPTCRSTQRRACLSLGTPPRRGPDAAMVLFTRVVDTLLPAAHCHAAPLMPLAGMRQAHSTSEPRSRKGPRRAARIEQPKGKNAAKEGDTGNAMASAGRHLLPEIVEPQGLERWQRGMRKLLLLGLLAGATHG